MAAGGDVRRFHTYPLEQFCDMQDEMKAEAMENCVAACEKFPAHNENAAKMIKEGMDKKFGYGWHCIVGEGFGFEITHEKKCMLYLFFQGTVAVCLWKCV